MNQGFDILYVYTDIVESWVAGVSLVPLLRIVQISGTHSYTVSTRFFQYGTVQYMVVLRKEFRTILVDIKDDTG